MTPIFIPANPQSIHGKHRPRILESVRELRRTQIQLRSKKSIQRPPINLHRHRDRRTHRKSICIRIAGLHILRPNNPANKRKEVQNRSIHPSKAGGHTPRRPPQETTTPHHHIPDPRKEAQENTARNRMQPIHLQAQIQKDTTRNILRRGNNHTGKQDRMDDRMQHPTGKGHHGQLREGSKNHNGRDQEHRNEHRPGSHILQGMEHVERAKHIPTKGRSRKEDAKAHGNKLQRIRVRNVTSPPS